MDFTSKSTNDLVLLANAGGGFRIKGNVKPVNDLVLIASAASRTHAKIIIENSSSLGINDLVLIANAGKGSVFFE